MKQLLDLADCRLLLGCIYCGGPVETREHVPSRILLEPPYPENLPVVGSCLSCNNGFSKDEQYFVCLIESALAGSTDPDLIRRSSVAKALRRSPALRTRIESGKTIFENQVVFSVESDRFSKIILKLARGHSAFELSQECREEPDQIWWSPVQAMSLDERESFEDFHIVGLLGEIGSRGFQRTTVVEVNLKSRSGELNKIGLIVNDWVDVQENFYRYLAIDDSDKIKVKMVIAEYLACEVVWNK